MGTMARAWFDEGRVEGRVEGERRVLVRLLERKFGDLDDATRQRVLHADVAELDAWTDRLLDAVDIDGVFSK